MSSFPRSLLQDPSEGSVSLQRWRGWGCSLPQASGCASVRRKGRVGCPGFWNWIETSASLGSVCFGFVYLFYCPLTGSGEDRELEGWRLTNGLLNGWSRLGCTTVPHRRIFIFYLLLSKENSRRKMWNSFKIQLYECPVSVSWSGGKICILWFSSVLWVLLYAVLFIGDLSMNWPFLPFVIVYDLAFNWLHFL